MKVDAELSKLASQVIKTYPVDVSWSEMDTANGLAYVNQSGWHIVLDPRITDTPGKAMAVALHELAHLYHKHIQTPDKWSGKRANVKAPPPNENILMEVEAWTKALEWAKAAKLPAPVLAYCEGRMSETALDEIARLDARLTQLEAGR